MKEAFMPVVPKLSKEPVETKKEPVSPTVPPKTSTENIVPMGKGADVLKPAEEAVNPEADVKAIEQQAKAETEATDKARKAAEAEIAAKAVQPQVETAKAVAEKQEERLKTATQVAGEKPVRIPTVAPIAEPTLPTGELQQKGGQPTGPETKPPIAPTVKTTGETQPAKKLSWWDKLMGRKEQNIQPETSGLKPGTQELNEKLEKIDKATKEGDTAIVEEHTGSKTE
jgi:hypothetical protein